MSSNPSYERYSRQTTLKEFGQAGQQQLARATVLMIGAGGLGCAALPYLAAAGVGNIVIIDHDVVVLHNLHRQILYRMQDIGLPKAQCAAAALQQLNPDIQVRAYHQELTVANALKLIDTCDLVIDGTDNFATRYLVNDACVLLNKPLVYGAVSKFEGQVTVFNFVEAGQPAPVNYRDVFPQPPAAGEIDNCAEAGVLGVLPGIIGVMQANEAIKLLTGIGTPLVNRLYTYNALNNQVYELELTARPGTRSLIPADAATFEQMNYKWLCGIAEDEDETAIDNNMFDTLLQETGVLIADVREPGELPVINTFKYTSMPLSSIRKKIPIVESNTIVLFCQSGKRSLQAAALLKATFGNSKKIYSLSGGILHWNRQQV